VTSLEDAIPQDASDKRRDPVVVKRGLNGFWVLTTTCATAKGFPTGSYTSRGQAVAAAQKYLDTAKVTERARREATYKKVHKNVTKPKSTSSK
jgi:hypothetical protein